jgi:hypothetical protein
MKKKVAKYDRIILVQRAMFIKWKQPTIVARYLCDSTFEVGDNDNIVKFKILSDDTSRCKENNIYEISSKLKILRMVMIVCFVVLLKCINYL